MNILSRNKLSRPIRLNTGDTLSVIYHDHSKYPLAIHQTTLDATQAMTVDEAVLFTATFEGRRALGGMVLEVAK